MTVVRPFRALRPDPDKAQLVACVPYDVVREDEVRDHIAQNPISFLRVTRPEAEFPPDQPPSPEAAHERAASNLKSFIDSGVLRVEDEPAVYLYRLTAGDHTQTGVVACCSLDEYEKGMIKRHENTRPDKVKERTAHLLTLNAQTGLILLAFRESGRIRELIKNAASNTPLYEFTGVDGALHTMWQISDAEDWVDGFAAVQELYIADGHHRLESAASARRMMMEQNPGHRGDEDYNFVMAGLFPAGDLKILAYNRAVKDLNGCSEEEFLSSIRENFIVSENGLRSPLGHREICMYFGRKWFTLRFAVEYFREPDPIERLDVSILQNYILGPILGIDDPRTDERINFIGGKRGTLELERIVDSGEAMVAFSLFPTTMDDMLAVSDVGEIMPPKSTWFEPKLKDGLLVHLI
ncbi:MAG: DUF1015 domain-containing protein [Pyrinomonadaceae bacterium]